MENIVTKKCPRCNTEKQAQEFNRNKSRYDGLSGWCKECEDENFQNRKSKNPEKILELGRQRNKMWAKNHPERAKELSKKSRLKNIDKVRERDKRRLTENPEKEKARYKKYRDAHPERNRDYRERNIDKIKKRMSDWWKNNLDKRIVYSQKRRAQKSLGRGVTVKEWLSVLEFYEHRCLCCGFEGKMTMDHVVPLSLGGRHEVENIQPLCHSCNSRKGARHVDYRIQ